MRHFLLDILHWIFYIGYFTLDILYWIFYIGYFILDILYWIFYIGYFILDILYWIFRIRNSLLLAVFDADSPPAGGRCQRFKREERKCKMSDIEFSIPNEEHS